MIRRTMTVLGTALLLASPLAVGAATLHERSERTDDARGIRALVVDDRRGRVEIRPSADGRIHVLATKTTRAPRAEQARDYARQTVVNAGAVQDSYTVKVEYPRRVELRLDLGDLFRRGHVESDDIWPPASVDLLIEVPVGLPVTVRSGSADVETDGLGGDLDVRSASGDVLVRTHRGGMRVETASGDVTVFDAARAVLRTSSGDVRAEAVAGPLEATTASGDVLVRRGGRSIHVSSASGDLSVLDAPYGATARTSSGRITASGVAGEVVLSTTSGDVQARLRGPLASAVVETATGDVDLQLVPGLGARLQLDTTSGSLDCRAPARDLTRERRSLSATIGAGGASVRVTTVSGDVTVSGGGNAP